MKKIFLTGLFGLLVLLAACSSVSTHKVASIDVSHSPVVFLRIQNDMEKLADDLSRRIEALGFTMTQDADRADYFAEVQYETFFDVVHQTFDYFSIKFADAKTGEPKIHARYNTDFSSKGCKRTLDLVFKDLAGQLRDEAAPATK